MRTLEDLRMDQRIHFWRSLLAFCKDIKISHSIFAMPFAFSVFFLENLAVPSVTQVVLLALCMIMARSFAMGINRFLDRNIDKQNLRTQGRMIPSGKINPFEMLFWTTIAASLFVLCTAALGKVPLYFSIPLLIFLGSYSYLKRVTFLTHFYLGACLGLSPLAIQVALTGQVSLAVMLLGLGVACWTCGFDILYATQDINFDRDLGLYSYPTRFGTKVSYVTSLFLFFMCTCCWYFVGVLLQKGLFYYMGVLTIALVLIYEIWIVRDLYHKGTSERLNQAFFAVNGWVSVVFLFFAIIERNF